MRLVTDWSCRLTSRRRRLAVLGAAILLLSSCAGPAVERSTSTSQGTAEEETATPSTTRHRLPDEEEIGARVEEVFEGVVNWDDPRNVLIDLDLNGNSTDGYNVTVLFAAQENFTIELISKSIQLDMTAFYSTMYSDGELPIVNATAVAFFPLADRFGNEEPAQVVATRLSGEVAQDVDWDLDIEPLAFETLPTLWEALFVHPAFQGEPEDPDDPDDPGRSVDWPAILTSVSTASAEDANP